MVPDARPAIRGPRAWATLVIPMMFTRSTRGQSVGSQVGEREAELARADRRGMNEVVDRPELGDGLSDGRGDGVLLGHVGRDADNPDGELRAKLVRDGMSGIAQVPDRHVHPSPAKAAAAALPIPLAPPVTTATRPFRFRSIASAPVSQGIRVRSHLHDRPNGPVTASSPHRLQAAVEPGPGEISRQVRGRIHRLLDRGETCYILSAALISFLGPGLSA